MTIPDPVSVPGSLVRCRECGDGMVREAGGWAICDGCHGTTFALPIFPLPELMAEAQAAHHAAVQAAVAAKQSARREASRRRRRDVIPFATFAALALMGFLATVATVANLVHDARTMQGQPVEVLAERAGR